MDVGLGFCYIYEYPPIYLSSNRKLERGYRVYICLSSPMLAPKGISVGFIAVVSL